MYQYLTKSELNLVHELIAKKLLNIRLHEKHKDVAILKYSKRAFWTGAWDEYPILKRLRGMVVDMNDGRIIINPFDKVFNYGEKPETETMFEDDEVVIVVEKVNGFLGLAVYDDILDDVIICSSGTFDSDFANMAEGYLAEPNILEMLQEQHMCFMFEICHPNDPHVVEQEHGAYLIGAKNLDNGELVPESMLNELYEDYELELAGVHIPLYYASIFKNVVASRGMWTDVEGFMIKSRDSSKIMKVKGTFYLTMKFLSRSKKVDAIWDDPKNFLKSVDEDFHEIVEKLPEKISKEDWHAIDDQQKLAILREVYNDL